MKSRPDEEDEEDDADDDDDDDDDDEEEGPAPLMLASVRTRITLAMASLVILLAVASGIAVREVMRLEELSTQVAAIEESTRRVHRVGVAMRDAYAHQAHMVILDDRSHFDHYGETHTAALRAVDAARAALHDPQDLARLDGIAHVVEELDRSFRQELLPLIGSGAGGARLAGAHDKVIHIVEAGQGRADQLTQSLDARAAAIHVAVKAVRERLFGRCALLFAAALLLSMVVTVILDRQISVPVHDLELAARRLGDGDLATRVVAEGSHELASLARHFNVMASELQERERRLLEAERLAGVGRLAAGVAHEINNPLGVMLGYVHLIERRAADVDAPIKADLQADAAMVRAEIQRCQHIVAGLLELARPPRLQRLEVDLAALAKDAAAPLAALPDGRPRVQVHAEGKTVADVDEGKLLQVLRNLLQNAAEAAPDDVVHVDVRAVGDQVIVRVADAGPGLTDEARRRLFEPFFTSKARGTGLGLAVSRAFAEAHDGKLEHIDTPAGATFQLSVPRTARSA